jgi:DNA-binding Xre family transcriptional regulator
MVAKNEHVGSDFDDYLQQEGIQKEVEAVAIKRVITYQMLQAMKEEHLSKTNLAKRMHTSRSALDRLFDPDNDSITLHTLHRAATALGRKLKIELV